MVVTEISKAHSRKDFDCGVPELNSYLRSTARQHSSRNISRTYVLVEPETPTEIIGFYTITYADVKAPPDSALASYPHPLASMKIARLAVDLRYRGHGYGEHLLLNALEKACLAYQVAPIIGVFVDAKDNTAREFYSNYGFDVANEHDDEYCLWLPIGTCIQLFS